MKITGKALRKLGFPESPAISVAMEVVHKHYKFASESEVNDLLAQVLADPEAYLTHEYLNKIAAKLVSEKEAEEIELVDAVPYEVFGRSEIEEGAFNQMKAAARLPVAVAGSAVGAYGATWPTTRKPRRS